MPRQTISTLRARIAELEGEVAVLRGLAMRDPLTGAFNRRAFNESMEREAALASRLSRTRDRRYARGLLVLDLNDFKLVNDTHGHSIGDEALRRVADVARQCVRGTDAVCRIGGDEFAVILSDPINLAGITEVAKRIVAMLAERPIVTEHGPLFATVSVGGSVAEVVEQPKHFFERVDGILMGQAKPKKIAGKSIVVCVLSTNFFSCPTRSGQAFFI
jgi:diguanylate cyclase